MDIMVGKVKFKVSGDKFSIELPQPDYVGELSISSKHVIEVRNRTATFIELAEDFLKTLKEQLKE